MRYCTRSISTGEILKWTSHVEEAPDGYVCEERDFDARDGFIDVSGVFVPMPPQPGPWAAWDWISHAWVDARTLADLRTEKWNAIKAQRDAVEFGGFEWDGVRFDSDAISQGRITGAVQLAQIAGEGWSIDWTLADNSVRTLSTADMVAVGVALGQHVGVAHDIARELRARIAAADSAVELDAISWPVPPA